MLYACRWSTDFNTLCVMIPPNKALADASIVTCCDRNKNLCDGFFTMSLPCSNATDSPNCIVPTTGFLARKYRHSECSDGMPEMDQASVITTDGDLKFPDLGACFKQSPPALLDTLISMFMKIGTVDIRNQLYGARLACWPVGRNNCPGLAVFLWDSVRPCQPALRAAMAVLHLSRLHRAMWHISQCHF